MNVSYCFFTSRKIVGEFYKRAACSKYLKKKSSNKVINSSSNNLTSHIFSLLEFWLKSYFTPLYFTQTHDNSQQINVKNLTFLFLQKKSMVIDNFSISYGF